MKLLTDVDVDTDGVAQDVSHILNRHNSDLVACFCWAVSFGGGTVQVQVSPDGGVNWFILRSPNDNQVTFTVSDLKMGLMRAPLIRGRLTGSAGASDVNLVVF